MKKISLLTLLIFSLSVNCFAFDPLLVFSGSGATGGSECSDATDYIGDKGIKTGQGTMSENRFYAILVTPVCASGCSAGHFADAFLRHNNTGSDNAKVLIYENYADDENSEPDGNDTYVDGATLSSSVDEELATAATSGAIATCAKTYWLIMVSDATTWDYKYENDTYLMWYADASYSSPPANLGSLSWSSVTRTSNIYVTFDP